MYVCNYWMYRVVFVWRVDECIVYVQVEMYSMSVVWVYRKCTSCIGVCKYKCVQGHVNYSVRYIINLQQHVMYNA